MKKFFLGIVILIVLAVGALAVFISTFDLNRYKPMIIQKASQALGAPVELRRISLAWKGGVVLRVQDFLVFTNSTPRTVSAQLKEAAVHVKLGPLLNKEIEVTSIVLIEPQAILVKTPDGKIGLKDANIAQPSNTSAADAADETATPMPAVKIDLFQVRSGAVRFQDLTAKPSLDLSVKNIDVDVKNFSLTDAFSFVMRASLFSSKQNLEAEGRVSLPQAGKGGFVKNAVFKTDLSSLNLAETERALPAAESAGLEELRGILETKIDYFDLGGTGSMNVELALEDGRVKVKSTKSALDNILLKAKLSGGDLKIDTFSADFAGGKIKTNGVVKQFRTQALTGLTWSSKDLALDQMMPESGNGPKLSGRLSLDLEGQAAGKDWPQISQTLSGQGRFELKDGVLLNYNLLRTVVQKISMVPGAEEALRNNLPSIYKAKMNEPSTILQPVQVPFTVQNGQIYFNQLNLVTDFILVQGAGQIGLDKSLSMRSTVRIHQQLSQAIVSLVPQAQLILNAQGEIEMPVTIQGRLPQVSVVPDSDYIAKKLLSSEAVQKTIKGFVENPEQGVKQIRNLLDKPAAAGESGVQNTVAGLLQAFGAEKEKK